MRQLRVCAFVLVLAAVLSPASLRAVCTDNTGCSQGRRCCACQCIVGYCNPVFECPRDFAPPPVEGAAMSVAPAATGEPAGMPAWGGELRLEAAGSEAPAIGSPAPAPGPLEPAPPVFAATCSSIYQACLAGCGSDTACRNKCYCNWLDCIGSDAPCPS
jgi:hypothetical protein